MRKKVFWTRLRAATVLIVLISVFSFGSFERVAEAQELPPPLIDHIAPASAEQGQTLDLIISGMHFKDGATLSFSPPTGINETPVILISPMELDVTITIAKDAPAGPKDVTVTNPDGQYGTSVGGFVVTEAKPTIDMVPPPAITGLTALDAHDGKVNLSWNPSTSDDFQYYAIYIGEIEITDVTSLSSIIKITDMAVHTYQVTGLKDNTTYWFAVTAVDISGNENTMVTSVSATPTPSITPAPRIEVSDIIVTPLQPKAGDNVTFKVSIANTGTAPAAHVSINIKLDDNVVYGMIEDIPAGSSVAIVYSWQAEPGEHHLGVEVADASGAGLATSLPYVLSIAAVETSVTSSDVSSPSTMGGEATGLPIGIIVVIVLGSLAVVGVLVWRFLMRPRVVTYVGKYPVRGLNEIPYYPSSPWDPEPPQWWEEEVPPKPPPSIPYALVPLNLDYIWAWIERWNRRLAIVWAETLLMPADWDEYERRWRQQWELDSLDDLERGVEDVIANLERQIWVLEQELDLNRVLTRVDDTNEYMGGPQFKAEEIDGIKKELEEAKKKLDEWKQAQEELRRIRREIEQRNLRSGGPKPL